MLEQMTMLPNSANRISVEGWVVANNWKAETWITGDEPKECVRVQQHVHFMYGSKSANGAAKSSAKLTNPRALPGSIRVGGLEDGSLASSSTSCNNAACAESGSVLAFE